jgi:GT2 family glycosyltransferase
VIRISALIVTRDHANDIEACLESLRASTLPPSEVIVVDHASIDGTADHVRRMHPSVVVLDYRDNPGFGEGINRARRIASGEALLFLNPDATVAPDCIERLAATLEGATDIAAVGPKVLVAGDEARICSAGLRVNRVGYACDRGHLEPDSGRYDSVEEVLAASGCALLVRASACAEVGGFDRSYFLYYEDLDLCWRLWLAGHRVIYQPAALAHHRSGDAGGVFRHYHDHRNRLLTILKNCGLSTLARVALPLLWFELESVAALALRGRLRALGWRLRAQLSAGARLPSALADRRRIQRARRTPERRLFAFLTPEYGNPPAPLDPPLQTPSLRAG